MFYLERQGWRVELQQTVYTISKNPSAVLSRLQVFGSNPTAGSAAVSEALEAEINRSIPSSPVQLQGQLVLLPPE